MAVALLRETGETRFLARSLNTLGNVLQVQGELDRAASAYKESEEKAREAGDPHLIATTTHNRGLVALLAREYSEAAALLDESLALARQVGAPNLVVNALLDLAYVALHEGRHGDAAGLCRETLETNAKLGWKEVSVCALLGLAAVAIAEGDLVRAAKLRGSAEASREALGLQSWLEGYIEEIADQTEAALRPHFEDVAVASAHSEGQTLNLDESTAYALKTETKTRV